MIMMKKIVLWGLLCGLFLTARAAELPPLDTVIKLRAEAVQASAVQATWEIAEGYFLLRSKLRFAATTPGAQLGEADYPEALVERDDFFGDLAVYRRQLSLLIPVAQVPAGESLQLTLSYQACQSMALCYPPHTERFELSLPAVQDTKPQAQAASVLTEEEEEFLDPEQAFAFAVEKQDGSLALRWTIADKYYLYRDRVKVSLEDAQGQAIPLDFSIPPGEIKQDAFFGEVRVFHQALAVDVPLPSGHSGKAKLNVEYQGCAEAGLCYPPQKYQESLQLAAAPQPTPVLGKALDQLGKPPSAALAQDEEEEFLEPEQAFALNVELDKDNTLMAVWQIAEGYYLYRHTLSVELLSPGRLGEPQIPAGEPKQDPHFGAVEIYKHQLVVPVAVLDSQGQTQVKAKFKYQGCAAAGLCYPPQEKVVELSLSAPIATDAPAAEPKPAEQAAPAPEALSEQDSIARSLAQDNPFWVIVSFFGFGLLLALTPCVFPMIPILSSIIVGQGDKITTRQAFIMSLTYVLAMAVTYTVAGVLAAALGENIQAAFQNPWVLGSFALVFVLLSLSMFGFYDLQLPTSLQSKLTEISNQQQGGTLTGVAIMGFLSALIVGPCVAAPLAGALIYIAQTGDMLLGGAALFALSMGMGVPLLLIGTSAGKWLPRAGGWMNAVKGVFGVMLLAVAIWMLERVLDAEIAVLLWALLLIISSVYMGALDALDVAASGWKRFWKGIGVVLLLYGTLLIIGVASGGHSLLKPLAHLQPTAGTGAIATQAASAEGLQFQAVKGQAGLEKALAAAKADGKAVMLDFYADWCTSCKEMEHFTFTDAGVKAALSDAVLLQADVTPNDELDKALMKQFGLFGPPALLFFTPQGEELRNFRVVGFMPAAEFRAHVERALPKQGDK